MTTPLTTVQIGLIASATQTSGSDRYYFDLLAALREQGVTIRGVVLGDPAAADRRAAGDVTAFAPEGSRMLRRWQGLRRTIRPLLRREGLVVSHFAPHVFPVLDQLGTRPLVEHFHGPWALEGRANGLRGSAVLVRALEERAVYARARRIVVLSSAFGAILERSYGVPATKIRVVPGGVDVARFHPGGSRADARAALGLPADRPIVVTVRRLEPTKGLDRLIDAIAEVRRRVPDVLAVVGGTGSLAPALQAQVDERGLGDAVTFAGFVADDALRLLYRAADLAVVPTTAFEGFGLVVLEALACGTPVLVTPVTGLPEVVRDLEPRLILEGADAASIARGITAALDGTLPLPAAPACVAYAHRFAWPRIAARVRDVYAEAAR